MIEANIRSEGGEKGLWLSIPLANCIGQHQLTLVLLFLPNADVLGESRQ
jgi:hypothetical protein